MKATNTFNRVRNDWYSWTMMVQGTKAELDDVKQVVYHLHETFPNNRLVSTNASNNFARTAEGWGEFLVKVEAIMKSGKTRYAERWLDLGFGNTGNQKAQYSGDFTD